MDAQAALAHRSRGRLEKLLDSPYFARVDFVEGEEGASSSAGSAEGETAAARQITYLGRFALTWENQALISDWRSPVAALFYDFEPGPAAFEAPAGCREGTLALKRQISIEEGQLRYAVDSSSSVRDEVLATVLGRTSDAKMHDIVSSIQREQNAVIRDEAPGTLIIQGVAGSGKTSIALPPGCLPVVSPERAADLAVGGHPLAEPGVLRLHLRGAAGAGRGASAAVEPGTTCGPPFGRDHESGAPGVGCR